MSRVRLQIQLRSEKMYSWKWKLSELNPDKDVKVFSTFSCGGGSSMGYKRAGFQVLGNVEIDKKINEIYKKNHHPKFNYLMDLRKFNQLENLPEELYHLDILDGSPPCSTFSMSGIREEAWSKVKKFKEGQEAQRLDDLFFIYLDTVEKLRPKISIAENVTGILYGNARGYCNEIIKRYKSLGYEVQVFKLNAAKMDVPQARERVFFIANNQKYPKLNLDFNNPLIPYGKIRTAIGKEINKDTTTYRMAQRINYGDRDLSDVCKRERNKASMFGQKIAYDELVCCTLTAGSSMIRFCDRKFLSNEDIIHISTFPEDYDFLGNDCNYVCGMSVPPNMMANIAGEIWKQWLNTN